MTEQYKETHTDSSKQGIIGSLIDLGAATTNMAIDQVGNAFTALAHPGAALDHVKETMQKLSAAMNSAAAGPRPAEPVNAHELHTRVVNMEHISTESSIPHVHVSTVSHETGAHETVPHETKPHAKKINHRKS